VVSETPAPSVAPVAASGGDCASELGKYDWPQADAYKIMLQESSNDPNRVNDNPATGDYSVGCFQVNIIGTLIAGRPNEQQLKDPELNVKWAYDHYVNEGRTFCKTSGWYNSCKATGVR